MPNIKNCARLSQVLFITGYIDELQQNFPFVNFKRIEKSNNKYITNSINESVVNDLRIFKETQIKRILRNCLVSNTIKKKLSYFSLDEDKEKDAIYKLNDSQDLQENEQYVVHNLGHASQLIQLTGFNILTDPVFSSLNILFYPEKCYSYPDINSLTAVDVILISHNHRDHVDKHSLIELINHYKDKKWSQPFVFVPLGDKKLFVDFGFEQVFEVDWFMKISITKCVKGKDKTVHFVSIPADHRSGRTTGDIHKSLVLGWIINPDSEDVIFKYSGDTRPLTKETQYSVDAALWNEIKRKNMNQNLNKCFEIPDIICLEPSGPNYTRCDMDITHQSTSYSALLKFIESHNLSMLSKTSYMTFLNKFYTVMVHHNKYELGPDRFNEGLFVFKKLITYLEVSEDDLIKELSKQEGKIKNNLDKLTVNNNIPIIVKPILLALPKQSSLLVHPKEFIIKEIIHLKKQITDLNNNLIKEYLLNHTLFTKIGERLNCYQIKDSSFNLENVKKYRKSKG